jgi:fructoselysine-6-P-deglycase FrlB-like protein
MSGFLADIAAEPAVVRSVIAAADGRLDEPLRAAASILRRHPERPIVVTGMGSSLAAGRVLHSVLVPTGRTVILEDAGELLHYGLGAAANVGCLVAISQSGRSVETVRVIEQLRERGETPIIAIVNEMEILLHETVGVRAARHLAGGRGRGLVIVGRGPGLGAADYGALTIKEAAAVPAEAMSGGAFRHGPLELASADVGFVVLAPAGRTAHLAAAVAREVAGRGRPTWLIASADLAHQQGDPPELLGTPIPDLPEALAQLTCAVPLQQAAGELARAAGREAGVTIVATKVTDRE